MGRYPETNVRMPDCAWRALKVIKGERGLSRDETVRQLLAEHVAQQAARDPDERLTHISTLLRHPQKRLRSDPPVGQMLRLRLPRELVEHARAVSFRLPGQPERRGHRDYQARLLTDAVVTAIAVASREPLTDDVLEGLLPLLRHRAATGLWRLAVAATAQGAEREVYEAAAPPPSAARGGGDGWIGDGEERRVVYVADALRDEVAWHGAWRRLVVEWLARKLLVGDNAAANERMLFEQRSAFGLLQYDLENRSDYGHPLLHGLFGEFNDLEGRGGTAVWRAERKVDQQEFECWVMGVPGKLDEAPPEGHGRYVPPAQRTMKPVGWVIDNLGGWRAIVSPRNRGLVPEPWATHVTAGRVLQLAVGDREILWPVTRAPGSRQLRPVDGIEVVLAAANRRPKGRRLSPLALIECVLLRLDYDRAGLTAEAADDLWELLGQVEVPVHTAHRLGLIDTPTRDDVVAQAGAARRTAMSTVISKASRAQDRQALEDAMATPTKFMRIARGIGIPFTVQPITWVWPVRSLADEVLLGTGPAALTWLSNWVFGRYALGLERSMERAWHRAFDRFQPDGTGFVTSTVVNGAFLRSRLESEQSFRSDQELSHEQAPQD